MAELGQCGRARVWHGVESVGKRGECRTVWLMCR